MRIPRTSQEVARLAEQRGFRQVRQSGSHRIYRHQDGRHVIIPMHPGDLAPGTLRKILKVILTAIALLLGIGGFLLLRLIGG